LCSKQDENRIVDKIKVAKYYSIIVDATPDAAHIEQNAFIFRYVRYDDKSELYKIEEHFLSFENCNLKTGAQIATLIREKIEARSISISDCRGQGYDNGSNISGCYKGVQKQIIDLNKLAVYSPCGCHTLDLCGIAAAACCPDAITFFGVILQKCYNIFSSSPQRWEILLRNVKCSLHTTSDTRWSAGVDCVKPFVAHLRGIVNAIDELFLLNLNTDLINDLKGIKKCITSFKFLLMSSTWLKILIPIDLRNNVIQARIAIIDVEKDNIASLISELTYIQSNWNLILQEYELVATNLG
jgi:hypothetical protein